MKPKAAAPARMRVMNSDGELVMLSELAAAACFQIEVARLEAANSKPTTIIPGRSRLPCGFRSR